MSAIEQLQKLQDENAALLARAEALRKQHKSHSTMAEASTKAYTTELENTQTKLEDYDAQNMQLKHELKSLREEQQRQQKILDEKMGHLNRKKAELLTEEEKTKNFYLSIAQLCSADTNIDVPEFQRLVTEASSKRKAANDAQSRYEQIMRQYEFSITKSTPVQEEFMPSTPQMSQMMMKKKGRYDTNPRRRVSFKSVEIGIPVLDD